MHQTLLLLVMTSLCSLSVGHKRVYHFINQSKTWLEAEEFCRSNYTDLATVTDQNDVSSVCLRDEGCAGAWVRLLNSTEQSNATWCWTDGKIKRGTNVQSDGNCAYVTCHNNDVELSWHNQSCEEKRRFMCCENPLHSYKCQQTDELLTWCEALHYCQKRQNTLVSGLDQTNQCHCKTDQGLYPLWWIVLLRSPTERSEDFCGSYCAKLDDDNSLKRENCSKTQPFICYDDDVVLVKKNMTWEEALIYCRRNHGDLATMTDEQQQSMVKNKANMADTEYVWVGLLYACFFEEWLWVNGDWVSSDHENWEDRKKHHGCGFSGAMSKTNEKWIKMNFEERQNFVCSIHH